MLVLTRKRFETIRIGDDIVLKVIKVGKTAIKIGIDAPDHVRVMRGELCDGQPMVPRSNEIAADNARKRRTVVGCPERLPHAS